VDNLQRHNSYSPTCSKREQAAAGIARLVHAVIAAATERQRVDDIAVFLSRAAARRR